MRPATLMYPAKESLQPVAQVLKSYGTEGEILIGLYSTMPEEIDLDEPVFLFYEGLSVPFFIENFTMKGSTKAIVKLEDIDSLDEAEEISGQKIFMAFEYEISSEETDSDEYNTAIGFIGYTLIDRPDDRHEHPLGTITGVSDFGGNICLEIGENLYPYHTDLIISTDRPNKTLIMRLPEGL